MSRNASFFLSRLLIAALCLAGLSVFCAPSSWPSTHCCNYSDAEHPFQSAGLVAPFRRGSGAAATHAKPESFMKEALRPEDDMLCICIYVGSTCCTVWAYLPGVTHRYIRQEGVYMWQHVRDVWACMAACEHMLTECKACVTHWDVQSMCDALGCAEPV